MGYNRVRRWTKNVDIFAKKFVYIPIVQGSHWSLAVLTNLDKLKVKLILIGSGLLGVVLNVR